jgi:16S rRNA processing protein RimM
MLEEDTVFEPGRGVILSREGKMRETEIEYFRRQHGRCIMKFRGIDSISDAEKHIGDEVRIPKDQLPVPKDGWFYTFQLKGCQVFTTEGEFIGTVTDIIGNGGSEVLKVDLHGEETLVPFAQPFISNIDPEGGRIEVYLPEDLRNLNK